MTPIRTTHFLPTAMAVAATTLAVLAMPFAARAETCSQVEVQNVRVGQGLLMVAAYDSAANFNKTPALQIRVPPKSETVGFLVCVPEGNQVAITMYQDLNGNGKIDTSVLGIPSEPYGASGKPVRFGPPTWESAKVVIGAEPIVVALSK